MGCIVSGKQRFELRGAQQRPRQNTTSAPCIQARVDGVKLSVHAGRKADATQLLADLACVQDHFGLSKSLSLKIALHLTANSIRSNHAVVQV